MEIIDAVRNKKIQVAKLHTGEHCDIKLLGFISDDFFEPFKAIGFTKEQLIILRDEINKFLKDEGGDNYEGII